ncbi:hypothetical protein [Bacillus sp. FSL R5-0677]|uniref:hypothetical protein n=1 Tax=Bacillus sp. FSL R5-0677 TaxID=2921581 RepID=UPI0030F54F66
MENWTNEQLLNERANLLYEVKEAVDNHWYSSARSYINTLEKINIEMMRRKKRITS